MLCSLLRLFGKPDITLRGAAYRFLATAVMGRQVSSTNLIIANYYHKSRAALRNNWKKLNNYWEKNNSASNEPKLKYPF